MKVGDLVKLKSGGPVMTISATRAGREGDMLTCVWYAPDSDLFREQEFPSMCLCEAPTVPSLVQAARLAAGLAVE